MTQQMTVSLNNGVHMPMVGLGTWKSQPGEVVTAVKAAIDAGYRHIDCAYLYLNEAEVGEAIRDKIQDGTVKRQDLFITSKIWNTRHKAEDVRPSLQESLTALGLDYVDLYLIHWPFAWKPGKEHVPRDEDGKLQYVDIYYMETWEVLEECVDEGLIKAIGLSNFNHKQIQDVLNKCRIKPANLQVEIHPYLSQSRLVDYCHRNNITVTAYSPLGSPDRPWTHPNPPSLLNDAVIREIGKKYNKTPAQVILRWLLQRNIIVIPKSVTPSRIKENLQLFDFQLTAEEMQTISGYDQNMRLVLYANGESDVDRSAPYFPFNEEY